MPLNRQIPATLLIALLAGATACSGSGREEPPPSGIDLTTPVADLPGWQDIRSEIGEPPEATRLDTFLDFFREALDNARQDPDPEDRAAAEDGWWREAERALTSMVGAENAEIVLRWMESTFGRWMGGYP
jgi:hypothetical protein